MKYWLLKSEPEVYSIDCLKRDQKTAWTGVRNYQARNLMKLEMSEGDWGFFYHSNASPPGIAGLIRIVSKAKPDLSAQNPKDPAYDPKASSENPIWACVDVCFEEKFERFVGLPDLRANPRLKGMELLRKGSRLSVQKVEANEFREILRMAGSLVSL